MGKSTMIELVQELEKLQPTTPQIEEMIREAKAGEFHDYKNEKYLCGKMAIATIISQILPTHQQFKEQLTNIRNDVIEGEYDETPEDDDKERMVAALKENGSESLIPLLGLN